MVYTREVFTTPFKTQSRNSSFKYYWGDLYLDIVLQYVKFSKDVACSKLRVLSSVLISYKWYFSIILFTVHIDLQSPLWFSSLPKNFISINPRSPCTRKGICIRACTNLIILWSHNIWCELADYKSCLTVHQW